MSAGAISVKSVTKRFGTLTVLDNVSFEIGAGEIVCLLGPSGCGKSTCLDMLAGFDVPSEGSVAVDGVQVKDISPLRSVVFQRDSLFPWLTVYDNICLGPRSRKLDGVDEAARNMLKEVGLSDFQKHYPYQLSGGMRQRAAIARALLNRPEVLLMDEPFGALDAQTRLTMQELLLSISARFRPTVLFVTHDIDEAIFLGDRVLVMSARPGRIAREFKIAAPKPRSYEFLTSAEFNATKESILELFHHAER